MNNVIKLFESEEVVIENKPFTRLLGGFGNNKPSISIKQISDLMNYDVKVINQTINRNIKDFTKDDGFIKDLKEVTESDHNLETLLSLGYSKMAISKAKNLYILSQAGFLLYLKFAEGDKAIELYKNFIEEYFKTKAENIVMKKTLKEEKEFLIEQKKFILGSMIMEQDDSKKIEFFNQNEKLSNRIKEIEIVLSNKELAKKIQEELQGDLAIADSFTNSNNCFDIGVFAKILDIPHMGRNNLYSWLRKQRFLMHENSPYSKYSEYFKILPVQNKYTGRTDSKTLIKAKGIKYIFEKLIKDGKVIPKSINEVIEDLKGMSA